MASRDVIDVVAVKPLHGRDLVVGVAHLGRCRLDRDVVVIEMGAQPVDGCMYLSLTDVLILAGQAAKDRAAQQNEARAQAEKPAPADALDAAEVAHA